ncbi:MAG TPA: hypothetical protein VG055_05265, partial [Planctomycetaceae bacterium]|nr:hypothetical protein [Planctomycetaceae bacterium]
LPRERRTIVFSDSECRNLWQIPYFPKNMNSRPNLPVVLMLVAALSWGRPDWALGETPAGSTAKTVSKPAAKPPQKPLAAPQTPAAPAGPAAASAATSAPAAAVKSPTRTPPQAVPLPTDPGELLRMARERLTGNREKQSPNDVQSIRARIVERVAIGGRKFRLEGSYLQGTDLRLRLELNVVSEDPDSRVDGTLLEVCDGTILWANYQVGKEKRITRRDVSQILNASKTNGQINFSTVELGLGGLPALLASLDRWVKFESVTQEQINGKKFTVLAGAWKDARRKELLDKMSKQHLPEHVPDSVRIYLEPELLFPRRIAFLKHRGSQVEPLVELDLLDIVINGPMDEHQFEYAPPDGARPVDVTTECVQQLQNAGP